MAEDRDIVDARAKLAKRSSDPSALATKISEKRVRDGDKPLFAANLGKLAARLEPARPLAGARRIVDESGLSAVWEKRKRFIRLPGEETSNVSAAGEYGSNGATFVRLAEAAGSLLAPTRQEDVIQREQHNAVRSMAVGSTFLPTYEPMSVVDRAAKSILDEYAAVLGQAISERTRLNDLWSVLHDAPFQIETYDEEDIDQHNGLAAWRIVPEQLLRPQFNSTVIGGAYSFSGNPYYDWAEPSVSIGHVALRTKVRTFRLPDDIQPFFARSARDASRYLPKKARRWLEEIGWKPGGYLPEVDYDDEEGFGWEDVIVSAVRAVWLRACRSAEDGAPVVRLAVKGDIDLENIAFSRFGCRHRADHERQVVEGFDNSTQVSFVDIDGDEFLQTLHLSPFQPFSPTTDVGDPPIFGLLETPFLEWEEFEAFAREGWTDDAAFASVLLSDEHQFYGQYAKPQDIPLHPSSVGAALIWNLKSAPDGERYDQLLLEKCRLAAESGLRFHEALVEEAREALRRI